MIEHASESTEQNANSRVLKLPVPERAPVLSGPVRKTPDQSQAHSAFPVIRLGLSPGVAFSLPLRHGLSYMSIAECARLRLSFPYRNFQSLSELRSCQVRYEKRLTRVRRILLFL